MALAAFLVLLIAVIPPIAFADGGDPTPPTSTEIPLSLLEKAVGANGAVDTQLTDPQAARDLPHRNLGRAEAVELTEAVFGSVLEGIAGPLQALQVDKYLSNQVAVVSESEGNDAVETEGGEVGSEGNEGTGEQRLLESSVPLQTENEDGDLEPLDLQLSRSEDGLRPDAPLVEVEIPQDLGDGIHFSESGITMSLAGAPQRAPSIVGETVATYPNVAEDSDFSVSPTPTGLETLMTLRSPAAPRSEVLSLDLPQGDVLREIDGRAEVLRGGNAVLRFLPPTAIDAAGNEVPVTLSVGGSSIELSVTPSNEVAYPILVDPLVESYNWYAFQAQTGQNTWHFQTNITGYHGWATTNGLYIEGQAGHYFPGDQSGWYYWVPRLKEEEAAGRQPTTNIAGLHLGYLEFITSVGSYSPYLTTGILGAGHWAGINGQEAKFGYGGNAPLFYMNSGLGLDFANGVPGNRDPTAKVGLGLALASVEDTWTSYPRRVGLGYEAVELSDEDNPSVVSASSTPWVNQTSASSLIVEAMDTGLGVKSVTFERPDHSIVTATNPCYGTVEVPCPRKWVASLKSSEYSPAQLPQGLNYFPVAIKDVVNNSVISAPALTPVVKVDHTAPQITLGGTLTEQASLGLTRPRYGLSVNAIDGTAPAPQSGVVKEQIKVDGKIVLTNSQACATQNCAMSKEWTLTASEYALGKHTVEVEAVDAVGLATTKVLSVELAADTVLPTLNVGGTLKGASEWVSKPGSYTANAVAADGGTGVTTLVFRVDKALVAEGLQTCQSGGCAFNKTFSLNTSSYGLGQHEAEIIARDGAGNPRVVSWQFSVNATGAATPSGVAAIDNALMPGSGVPTPASQIGGLPYQASLGEEDATETLDIVGSGSGGDVSLSPTGGAEVRGVSGLPIVMAPSSGVSGSATTGLIAGEDGVAYSNVGVDKDLLLRPIRNGVVNFVTFRSGAAVGATSWEILASEPVFLEKRADGGVNIVVDPSVEVPVLDGSEMQLSAAPQLVAALASPVVVDGNKTPVPAELVVSGSTVTLKVSPGSGVKYPFAGEVSLHITGPLHAWYPEGEDANLPSEVEAGGIGITGGGTPVTVESEWKANATGTELTAVLANQDGELSAITHAVNPTPGTEYQGTVVHPLVNEYAPTGTPVASASCFLGFCAGSVNCAVAGPVAPYYPGLHVIQTYGVIDCRLSGDLPPNFGGDRGGACLTLRLKLGDHFAWTPSKCKNQYNKSPNWSESIFVTKQCDNNNVYGGEAFGGPFLGGLVAITSSETKHGTQCSP